LACVSHWDEDKIPSQGTILVDWRGIYGQLEPAFNVTKFTKQIDLTKYSATTFSDNGSGVADSAGNHLFYQLIADSNSATDGLLANISTKLCYNV